MSVKNPKNAGRKEKFTEKQLLEIIDSFMIESYNGTIDGSKLADYAVKKLKYPEGEIKGYHFNQKKKVKKKIEEIQKERKSKYVSDALQTFQSIEIDTLVDRNIKNPLKFKEMLHQLQASQKNMFQKVMHLDGENRELKVLLKGFEDIEQIHKDEKRLMRNEISELKNQLKMLRSLIEVQNYVDMVKYIREKTYMDGDWAEQYLLFLLKCHIVTEKDAEELRGTKMVSGETNNEKIDSGKVVQMFRELEDQVIPQSEDVVDEYEDVSMDEINKLLFD